MCRELQVSQKRFVTYWTNDSVLETRYNLAVVLRATAYSKTR